MGPKKKKPLEESVWDDDRDGPFDEAGDSDSDSDKGEE
jgi:hypothetical protein